MKIVLLDLFRKLAQNQGVIFQCNFFKLNNFMFNLNFLKFPMFTIKFFDFDIKIPWFHNKNLWFWQNLTCFERRLINNLGSSNSCIVPYSIWIILWSLDVKVRDMSFLSSNVDSINETSWLLWFFFKKKTLQNSL